MVAVRRIFAVLVVATAAGFVTFAQPTGPSTPILFVTQVPQPADFATIGSVFANHSGQVESAPRGGDLWIRYPDGTLKNLTAAAGFGNAGQQGPNSIAVREPSVHWDGAKAIFSMVIGSYLQRYERLPYYWQIYEVTGLGPSDTPVITKVPNQPDNYNNISPIYGPDDRIIFTSDRPRDGQRHLYPQLDEYESTATNTGLWSLNPATGDLFMMNHSPSGVFTPIVDSFGRVIFTRWDHLQRDQQADADSESEQWGTFNYASEAANAQRLNNRVEVFPEPRNERQDLLIGTNIEGISINHFFPWQINDDGTGEETLNHIGRHELHDYFNRSFNDDSNLREFNPGGRTNPNDILNFLQIKEDPLRPGIFFGVDAPEFQTHAAGQLISIDGAPTTNPDAMVINYLTHRDTANVGNPTNPNHSGLYRNPVPLSNGMLIAVHTSETRADNNEGSRELPRSRYAFRLKIINQSGGLWTAGQPLTTGISKAITYWEPDVLVTYSGELWELDPVEVRPRSRPTRHTTTILPPEQQVFTEESIDVADLRRYMRENNLALVVSRNVTTRDAADRQQPFNLRIPDSPTQTAPLPGRIYDVLYMQFFQGDLIRGMGGVVNPRPGRRVLAQVMHDPAVRNPPLANPIPGAVRLGTDGSMAAFVPARRAMSWQLTSPTGVPVVRERYWLTFQAGEIRTCTSCHGLNTRDQVNRGVPQNKPQALVDLMRFYRSSIGRLGTPANLRATSIVGSTVALEWTAGNGLDAPTGYVIEGGLTPGSVLGSIPTGSASTTFSFAAPTGAFYLRVRAVAGGATSGASNEIRVFVNVPAPPEAPTNLAGSALGANLQLSWSNPASGGAPSAILLNVTGGVTLTLPLPGASQSFAFTGVPAGTYTFSVSAQNSAGTSGPSNNVTLSFPGACAAPGPPTNLQLTRSGNLVTAAWGAPTSGGAAASYTIIVSGSFSGTIPTVARTVSGMVGPGSYTVAITATNVCGTSAPTASQTITVP
jgi:hypothetical protein